MKKKITALIALILVFILAYNYIYKDHRDIKTETPDFVISSQNIIQEFLENQQSTEQNYLDKTIEITGVVTEINSKDLTLDDKVFCTFTDALASISKSEKVTVKGRCIGFDDLLEQVKLDQCTIIIK